MDSLRQKAWTYSIGVAALLVVSLLWIWSSQDADIRGALKRLGRTEREFELSKQELLLTNGDATKALLRYIKNTRSDRKRIDALRILESVVQHSKSGTGSASLVSLLPRASMDLKLALLQTLGAMPTVEGNGTIQQVLAKASDSTLFNVCYNTLYNRSLPVVAKMAIALRTKNIALTDSLLALTDSVFANRGAFVPLAAQVYQSRGRFDSASALYGSVAFLRNFWVMGPFDNVHMSGFYKTFAPDTMLFDSSVRVIAGIDTLRWVKAEITDPNGIITLGNFFVRQQLALCYLFTYITSPVSQDAMLALGSDDGVVVWLNDTLIHSNKIYRPALVDQDGVKIHLRKGVNRLRVKVIQDQGGWAFVARITDFYGLSIPKVRCSFDSVQQPTSTDMLVEALAAKSPGVDSLIKLRILANRGVDRELMQIVCDPSTERAARNAAIDLVNRFNSALGLREGERELLNLGETMITTPDTTFSAALLGALVSMKCSAGLELGLSARKSRSAAVAFAGNRLVSLACYEKVNSLGDLANLNNRLEIERVTGEVAALKPTDASVVERLAIVAEAFNQKDTAAALREKLLMPTQWQIATAPIDSASAESVAILSGIDSTQGKKGSWKNVTLEPNSANQSGLIFNLAQVGAGPRTKGSVYMLRCAIQADSAMAVRIAVNANVRVRLFFKGRLLGICEPEFRSLTEAPKPAALTKQNTGGYVAVNPFERTVVSAGQPGGNQRVAGNQPFVLDGAGALSPEQRRAMRRRVEAGPAADGQPAIKQSHEKGDRKNSRSGFVKKPSQRSIPRLGLDNCSWYTELSGGTNVVYLMLSSRQPPKFRLAITDGVGNLLSVKENRVRR